MGHAEIHLVDANDEIEHQFRSVMRRQRGDRHAGNVVTAPRLLVSINRQASSFPLIERYRTFGVNILGSDQQALADRFSNGRLKGRQRFEGAAWTAGVSGVPMLTNALATVECQAEEIMERHSHAIIVGRLLGMELSHGLSGLVYWNGQYVEISHDTDLDLLAAVSIPLAHVR
jgi:flavin reductase (DIM6/NTAB) family NADH-FMN oxidoreductase RutF